MGSVIARWVSSSEIRIMTDLIDQHVEFQPQEDALDEALEETFPASDPISLSRPVTEQGDRAASPEGIHD